MGFEVVDLLRWHLLDLVVETNSVLWKEMTTEYIT